MLFNRGNYGFRRHPAKTIKAREFDSKDAGQMSAYLSAVDDLLRHVGDNPSIGMILCKTKDNVFVEYVLRNFNRPIGVAEYETKIIESLPDERYCQMLCFGLMSIPLLAFF